LVQLWRESEEEEDEKGEEKERLAKENRSPGHESWPAAHRPQNLIRENPQE